MLSAIVILPTQPVRASGRSFPDMMVRTLASLVPAAVEGVLRDLTIAAPHGHQELERIADHAGCELVQAETQRDALAQALKATREDNVFLLVAGRAPDTGFADEIAEMIGDGQRIALMRDRPDSFLTRLLPGLSPAAGVLAPRDRLLSFPAADVASISRQIGAARTMRLRARRID